ncbi:beta-galactosidase [bacterium]|nr:beta-galactosidase [bacterium]
MSDWKLYDHRSIKSIIDEYGDIPRPEHPRPDRVRANWLNLNGVWDFAFDPDDTGSPDKPLDGNIVVPFCPESVLSGVYDEDLHTICRYARSFDLPDNMIGKRVLLHFGAVDHECDVWLNGRHLGQHEGGYDSFSFDITDIVKPADNRLYLRVHDDPSESKPKGKQSAERYPHGCIYMRTTGIWQTVWLEAVGDTYIKDWRLIDNPDNGELTISAEIDGSGTGLSLTASAYLDGKEASHKTAKVEHGKAGLSISVPDARLWSNDDPNLYDLHLSLTSADGVEVDSVDTYFGFRKIDIKDGQVYLNDKPFFIISALDQGFYPDGLYTPPTDDALRADVEWAKKYGLNHVRKHQIVAEPRFHYWCDKLGLTIWEEMADWGADIVSNIDGFLREWTACIKRDINHPCIIGWVPSNERKEPTSDAMNQAKVKLYEATKALDSTRSVVDNSGYCHTKTDIVDLHVNPKDGADCRRWWNDWRKFIAETENFQAYENIPTYCDGFKHQGQPVVISETGNWWIKDHMPIGQWKPCGYDPADNVEAYIALYRDFFIAMMAEPLCAGFSYVQLYDVEGEVNGYLTYDRKPKVAADVIAEIHATGLKPRK